MEHKKAFLPFIVLLVLIGVFAIVFSLMRSPRPPREPENEKNGSAVVAMPENDDGGSLVMRQAASDKPTVVGKEAAIVISADSRGEAITGFEISMSLSEKQTEYVSSRSLHPNFDIHPKRVGDLLRITGVKKLTVNDPVIFDGSDLVEITLTPQTAGNLNLKLIARRGGNDESSLINDDSENILRNVEDLVVEVKEGS